VVIRTLADANHVVMETD